MHAPLMPRRVRSEYTPWVTPALMREMKHRDYLNRRAVASKCDTKFTAFTSIKVNNNIYRSEEKIADNPNTYVSEIGEKRPSNPENTDRTFVEFITPLQSQFNFSLFTDDLIERFIKELKPCKSAGLDKISARLLKDSSVVVVPYLRVIFNLSLHQGIFPDDWKHARISPIFKSGDTEDCSNYIDQFQSYQLSLKFLRSLFIDSCTIVLLKMVFFHVTNQLDFVKGILPLHHC